jgi:hypothetical protein
MATDVQHDPGVAQLLSGIIDDTQRLLVQHAELLKADIRKDLHDAKEAGYSLGFGGAMLGAGGLLLLFMIAHLLNWMWELPLWGGFGITGGILALAGGLLFFRGQQQLDKIDPLPENTVQAVKEDLQWKTNRK